MKTAVTRRRSPPKMPKPVRSVEDRLQSIEKILQLIGSDVARLIERMPVAERVQAQLSATREHLAVQCAANRRLLGDKQALLAYVRGLEEQINERIVITAKSA